MVLVGSATVAMECASVSASAAPSAGRAVGEARRMTNARKVACAMCALASEGRCSTSEPDRRY